jgi:hypothetical protein
MSGKARTAAAPPAPLMWTPRAVYLLERAAVEHGLREREYLGLIEAGVRRALRGRREAVEADVFGAVLADWLALRPEDDSADTRPAPCLPPAAGKGTGAP